ncbi:MAG TPA: formate/nitrite transporter family protein, partial [Thermoleophilia bacterium]|nr:formate/nitrite transporter family protein [Thermoleophilia bacterium]
MGTRHEEEQLSPERKQDRPGHKPAKGPPGNKAEEAFENEPTEPEPELVPGERREVQRRTTVRAHVVHEAIRAEGEDELKRPPAAIWWSGLAAGLSMGFSMATMGLLQAGLPDAPWAPLVSSFGYTTGFLIVILGRQQLFTENT